MLQGQGLTKDTPFSFLCSVLIRRCILSLFRRDGFDMPYLPSEDHCDCLLRLMSLELHTPGLLQACVLQEVYYGVDGDDLFMSAL